ncbi:MAG: hypothetical protein ACLTNO_00755 [Blautia sp.]
MNEKKKISLIGCVLMGIGCIIGSGIFGSLPELINTTGSGIVYALLLAAFVVILRSITRMYTISALPTSASTFMHATKLMHLRGSVDLHQRFFCSRQWWPCSACCSLHIFRSCSQAVP